MLSHGELRRMERMAAGAPRSAWLAATAGMRAVAALYLDLAPERVPVVRGLRGKPAIDGGPFFNSTHTADCVLLAFARDEIGIDAELLGRRTHAIEIARKFFSEEETAWLERQPCVHEAFLRLWTRKEAMVKLTGDGLAHGLRGARVVGGACLCNGRPACCREYIVAATCLVTVASWVELAPNKCYALGEF
jgi:4'-phosphopantetheinyl transferase